MFILLRNSVALLLLGGTCSSAVAQQFSRRYDPLGQHQTQFLWSVELTDDGRVICIGNSPWIDSVYYSSVITTLELDLTGELLSEHRWEYPYRGQYPGWANTSCRRVGGGYVVGGSTIDTVGDQRPALFFLNSAGDPISSTEYDTLYIGRQAKQAPDGGFVLCGETIATGNGDAFLLKTDSLGNEEWTHTYGGVNTLEFAMAVALAPLGGYYLGGQLWPLNEDKELRVQRLDSNGEELWLRTWGSAYDEPNAHLISTADGNCVVASSWAYQDDFGSTRPYLAKLDQADGSILWEHQYDHEDYSSLLFAVKEVTPNGELIAVGQSYVPGYMQGVLLRTTSTGDSLWMRHYYYADSLVSDAKGTFRDVLPTPDGGFVAVGGVYSSASGNNPPGYNPDMWVVKVDSIGCLVPGCDTPMGITSYITNLKEAVTAYPNPAHASTVVVVDVPLSVRGKTPVMLSVVSAQGQLVRELQVQQGENQIALSAMANGIYYLHLRSGNVWVGGTKLVVE